MSIWRICFVVVFISFTACNLGGAECTYEAFVQKYTYSTSCKGVAKSETGLLSLQMDTTLTTQSQFEKTLSSQLQKQGLAVAEVVMKWSPERCEASSQTTHRAIGYERIVLLPQSSATSSIQVLLVCRPTSTAKETLAQPFLLACKRGPSTKTACTFQLTPQ